MMLLALLVEASSVAMTPATDLAAVIAQAVATVAGVGVVVHGALKGVREWRASEERKVDGMQVVPSSGIEKMLEEMTSKLDEVLSEQKYIRAELERICREQEAARTRHEQVVQRLSGLEERTRLAATAPARA